MFARNSLSKPAQFSFAADLFMMQALLRSEGESTEYGELEYVFPTSCYRQVIQWMLFSAAEIGLAPFEDVNIKRSASEVVIKFRDKTDEDRMHNFFELFNAKRRQAQGVDRSFPPLPDVYQGGNKPDVDIIRRYTAWIVSAFDGDENTVPIPVGPKHAEFIFHCS